MNNKTKIAGLVAAIALPATALAGGIAQAQTHHAHATQTAPAQGGGSQGGGAGQGGPGSEGSGEQTGGKDTDNIQLQQGPQTGGSDATRSRAATGEQSGGADTDNVQQGEQTGPDGAAIQAVTKEQAGSESGGPSDGPGGHEDVGNVDHQFDGEE